MTRRVTGWLVSDHGGECDDSWTQPVRVFTSFETAQNANTGKGETQ